MCVPGVNPTPVSSRSVNALSTMSLHFMLNATKLEARSWSDPTLLQFLTVPEEDENRNDTKRVVGE